MDIRDYGTLMAQHAAWANEQILQACGSLAIDELRRPLASDESLYRTLHRALAFDRMCLGQLQGHADWLHDVDDVVYPSLGTLAIARKAHDLELVSWARGLGAPWYMDTPFPIGTSREVPRYTIVVHMFSHQAYFRGRIIALLHQLGAEIGEIGLVAMPYFQRMIAPSEDGDPLDLRRVS